ncbi:tRNA glutamyl-Q(34) synthetase GluQRS [Aliikangiella sp. IMCC44359]|uniref:tRNA glutamyl-Q(34) synthetase GluQRS n=1 Tax=Aliikangiella sp. IMCC44359 TaxID=3459125 RepID=UPI00403AFC18
MKKWIGRFAPSPSGQLHFGSLVAALGSYLIARQQNGSWLLRIEDIDPPREVPGAAEAIIQTLKHFGFEWDSPVTYQSQRSAYYQQAIELLFEQKRLYYCDCSRKQIQQRNQGSYDGFCRTRQLKDTNNCALRIIFESGFECFSDQIQGPCSYLLPVDTQDFVIKRRDHLMAYQLAVVVDDIEQGVNHVVRGADILDSTPRQNFLYHCFNHQPPAYYHLPLVVDENQQKLSKSKLSSALTLQQASAYLVKALQHLGQEVDAELLFLKPSEILAWGVEHWQLENVGRASKIYTREDFG